MQRHRSAGLLCHAPKPVVFLIPVRRTALWGLGVNHRTGEPLLGSPLQFLDCPVEVVYGGHADTDESFPIVGHELRQPIVKDLRARLDDLGVGVS